MLIAIVLFTILPFPVFNADQPKLEEPESYVEFDFSTLPSTGEGNCTFTLIVLTADRDYKYRAERKGARKFDPQATCAGYAGNMEVNKFKAVIVDKTKLRVYGRILNGKLIPATKGMVESPDLTPAELPKVTNPTKKG